MRDACKRAKISPPISLHGMRHTYSSRLIMNGVPLIVVAKNLGHSDTIMIEKHYGHLAPSFVVDAIRAGAPIFGISPGNGACDTIAVYSRACLLTCIATQRIVCFV